LCNHSGTAAGEDTSSSKILKIKETLLALDLNTMTPMDALWKLNELVKIAGKK